MNGAWLLLQLMLQRVLRRLSLLALLGLAALVLALLLAALGGRALLGQREGLRVQLAQGQAQPAPAHEPVPDDSPGAQLARFYAGFPTMAAAPDALLRIQAVARRSGLLLQAGEYRLDIRSGERLQRYQIVLPVRGSYTQIRAFVDGVLAQVAALALDDIDLRRDSSADALLEGRIRLTLYVQGAAP